MAFSQRFIEELKFRNNIEQVIGNYVVLKKAGSNMVGCCPFHSERTPSFTVFPDKNFYCFGCGAGGDVITFIMRIENLPYREAIEFLCERAGMEMPKDDNSFFVKKETAGITKERNYEINKTAARIFYENLMSEDGAPAREYIAKRKLSSAIVRRFGLGYSKDSFDDLYKKLTEKGFSLDEIKAAFLCGIAKNGHPYDYFRNRLMFPIIDTYGNITAFGGRILDDSKPKYLNTSDTPVFKKSRTLFALNFAKNAAVGQTEKSGELILCEGYMDVISLHQAGFPQAVATLGTALTSEQARIMSRYAKTVYVSYDSDNAGKRADEKAISLLGQVGVEVKILKVTGGAKDPDEYIKKYGPEGFRRLMNGADGQIDYRLSELTSKYNLEIPDEKLEFLNNASQMLSEIYPEMKREIYVSRLCELTGISKQVLTGEIKRRIKISDKNAKKQIIKNSEARLSHFGDSINPDAVRNAKGTDIEEHILGLLLLYPEYIKDTREKLSPDDFITEFNRSVFINICKKEDNGEFDLSSLNEFYTPEQMGRIFGMYERRKRLTVNDKETLFFFVSRLLEEKSLKESAKAEDMSNDDFLKMFEEKRRKVKE